MLKHHDMKKYQYSHVYQWKGKIPTNFSRLSLNNSRLGPQTRADPGFLGKGVHMYKGGGGGVRFADFISFLKYPINIK